MGQNYKATYKGAIAAINYDSIFKNNTKLKKYNKDLFLKKLKKNQFDYIEASKRIKLLLIYNKSESFFFNERSLETPISIKKGFLIRLELFGIYYSNKFQTLIKKNSYGQDFIVDVPKYKWDITNQSKVINGYKCYKALTIKETENSKGTHKINIIAWFSPEIPFNYGPKEFNGLPGLIFELYEGNITFKLESLEKIKKIKFEKPTKGKKITEKEFKALSKKMYKNRRN